MNLYNNLYYFLINKNLKFKYYKNLILKFDCPKYYNMIITFIYVAT